MGVNSAYRAAVPQLFADVDREKVKKLGIPLQDVFSTMSGYLCLGVRERLQPLRAHLAGERVRGQPLPLEPDDIMALDVRKPDGSMVPLGTLLSVRETMGADRVIRYNIFPAAVVQGQPAPGVSSGEA
jgi:multidrug efflux pump subunit AcrB